MMCDIISTSKSRLESRGNESLWKHNRSSSLAGFPIIFRSKSEVSYVVTYLLCRHRLRALSDLNSDCTFIGFRSLDTLVNFLFLILFPDLLYIMSNGN